MNEWNDLLKSRLRDLSSRERLITLTVLADCFCKPVSRESSQSYKTGDTIRGKYDVIGILGEGGFGTVFLVHLRGTGLLLALKTIRDDLLSFPDMRRSFTNEALKWVTLGNHPHIVRALCVESLSGRLFIASEHILGDPDYGVTLDDALRRGKARVPVARAVEWGIQICFAMEHAAGHGLRYHGDIKPNNLLLSVGRIKVTDFGLAAGLLHGQLDGGLRNDSACTRSGSPTQGFESLSTRRHRPWWYTRIHVA